MSILETTRRVYARLKAGEESSAPAGAGARSVGSAESPGEGVMVDRPGILEGARSVGSAESRGGREVQSAVAQLTTLAPPEQEEARSAEPTPAYRLVERQEELSGVLANIERVGAVGLDTETTGLDARRDRVRLLSLAAGESVWLIDCFAVDPSPLFPPLADTTVIGHNLQFDLGFLARLGLVPGRAVCTMVLSQLVHGTRHARGFHGLGGCVGRELGQELPKELQRSDWSGELTDEQLAYAARDAAVLLPLYDALDRRVRATRQGGVAGIESRALPAIAWLAGSGVEVDVAGWRELAERTANEAEHLAREMGAAAPPPEQGELFGGGWNWDSAAQVKDIFARLGVALETTGDDALAAVAHPLAGLLRRYRSARRLSSTYGENWLKHVSADGRVYAGWRQIGSDAGRMSCSAPNLQQLPRDAAYRRCVRAASGKVLIKGDYSQIELRIAAKVSGDVALLEAYHNRDDLHTRTARLVLGIDDVTKQHRQLAKALNFGLLYGMGAKRFRDYAKSEYGQDLTERQARDYRSAFFAAYPGLARWHRSIPDGEVETRTLAGRRRQRVGKFNEKLNSPVQGLGADGLKLALALLWERRGQCPGAFPVLAVHDEIVIEAPQEQAAAAAAWLKGAMLDAMAPLIAPVPVEVEVKVGPTWAG